MIYSRLLVVFTSVSLVLTKAPVEPKPAAIKPARNQTTAAVEKTLVKAPPIVHAPPGLSVTGELIDSVREETCNNQALFCDNVCGVEKSRATVNECDVKTFAWSCMCDNGLQPNTTTYTFPVEFVVCTEQLRYCQNKCSGDSNCSHSCSQVRNCTAKDRNDGKPLKVVNNNNAKQPSIFSHAVGISPNKLFSSISFLFMGIIFSYVS